MDGEISEYHGFLSEIDGHKKHINYLTGDWIFPMYQLVNESELEGEYDLYDFENVFDLKVIENKVNPFIKVKCSNKKCKKSINTLDRYCFYCGKKNLLFKREMSK